jgi:hypothetical protein
LSKPYTSPTKTSNDWLQLIRGTDIKRYSLEWNGEYVKYGENLAAPRNPNNFFREKIFIRRTDDNLMCVIDNDKMIGVKSVHCIQGLKDDCSNKFIMTLINSKLLNWFFQYDNFHMVGKPLAEVKLVFVERLPIIISEDQQPFIDKADIMLEKNKELNQLSEQFTKLLQTKFPAININNKLQQWYSLTANEFFKELTKQKIKLSLPEQQEWLQYFEAEKTKANALEQTIQQTDKEIDAMVYALYGLTDDEIAIVEGK